MGCQYQNFDSLDATVLSFIQNALLIRLLKIRRQPKTDFALSGAYQVGAVPGFPPTVRSTRNQIARRVSQVTRQRKQNPEVRSFMGPASYHRRFEKDFAHIRTPLYTLTQRKRPSIASNMNEALQRSQRSRTGRKRACSYWITMLGTAEAVLTQAVAYFRCLAAMPLEGSTRAGIVPKPRQGKSRGGGRIRTTELPEIEGGTIFYSSTCNTAQPGGAKTHTYCPSQSTSIVLVDTETVNQL
ncbi:hypothetical protein T265_02919 [Opisthorchis viverrini]|uniref:Uncharacterized protein n=1 Tax=Opisthorchis viverrini TaxID=6198 RepID=A0A074ZXM9_OPIVI|nr:hypothetical protein T265_02919 [Opisthorchis viverrini]KER30677.1 hypothetical protein T265_02919 [Opisthorchis viverrini]